MDQRRPAQAFLPQGEMNVAKKKAVPIPALTPHEAQILCDAHDIDSLFLDEEECDLLQANNPELFAIYQKVREIAEAK